MSQNAYLALLRTNVNYRRLFLARTISLLGDWLNTIAILVLLSEISDTPALAYSGMLVIKVLPNAIFASFAGVVADRFPRRQVMIMSDLVRAFTVLCLLFAQAFPSPALVFVLLIIQTAVGTFFEPARSAILPDIVSEEELVTANALASAMWSLMLTLGSLIGGVLTEFFGWQAVVILDALSYLLSAYFIRQIVTTESVNAGSKAGSSDGPTGLALGFSDLKDTVTFLKSNPEIRVLTLLKSMYCLGGAVTLLLTIIGEKHYSGLTGPALGIALLYTARGLGTAFGPIISRRYFGTTSKELRFGILIGFLVCSFFYFLFSFTESLLLGFVFIVLSHLGSSTVWVFSTILLQQQTKGEIRGRIFGFELAAFTCVMSLSILGYGYFLENNMLTPFEASRIISIVWLFPALFWYRDIRRAEQSRRGLQTK